MSRVDIGCHPFALRGKCIDGKMQTILTHQSKHHGLREDIETNTQKTHAIDYCDQQQSTTLYIETPKHDH